MAGVVDAHQHIWDASRADYPWLDSRRDPALAPIDRAFGFDELRPQLDAAGVDATVLVQSADNGEDTALMLECAAREPRVAGVVAWAPLGDPQGTAAALDRYAALPVVKGVRVLIHDLPDPHWLLRPAQQEGLALLEASGLPFDVVAVRPAHLEAAIELGRRFPRLPLVIDHLGHPPLDGDRTASWWDLISAVAENPRASAKVSGLYPPGPAELRTAAVRPALDHAILRFGTDRLMYGGDWPISVLAGGYGVAWAALAPLIDGLGEEGRRDVLWRTACRIYRLDRSVRRIRAEVG